MVRGGEWLQYRARVVVIYVFTTPVRRLGEAPRDREAAASREWRERDHIGERGRG